MSDTDRNNFDKELDLQNKYKIDVQTAVLDKYLSPPLVFITTYGCQQNISDSERIRGLFSEMGFGVTSNMENADLILFNTCAIRESAQERIFGNIGELKRLKKQKPSLIVALCGCMIQEEGIIDRIKSSYPFVTLAFGTHVIHRLPEFMRILLKQNKSVFCYESDNLQIAENAFVHREDKVKGNIPIMYGCDNYCTYCIVPYVRGSERSRESEKIINEAKELIADGYKEIMLLGQNVNSYGKGLDDMNFSKLLIKLNELEGDFIIRFMTSHPKDISKELIDTIASCEKVCRHIHLPIQSGNDEILEVMNRKYTTESYLKTVAYAREKIDGVTFSSDIIVGFPGESYEQFADTLNLIKKVEFTQLFTFIYSKRPGTKAAELVDDTPHEEKARRLNELIEAQKEIGAKYNKSLVGKRVKVLADGFKRSDNSFIIGRTEQGVLVEFKGSESLIGNYVYVLVHSARNTIISGEIY